MIKRIKFLPLFIVGLSSVLIVNAQNASVVDRVRVNDPFAKNSMEADSPITFPKSGPLPPKFAPDVKQVDEPTEKEYCIFSSPCRSLQQIAAIQKAMPPGTFTPPAPDWTRLRKTQRILTQGGTLRILGLGDSIVNDTMRSGWVASLGAAYPKAKIEATVYVRGGGGCQHYRDEDRVAKNIVPRKPDLVIIGGISQRDTYSIAVVIDQIRAALPEVEILLTTGAFGTADPRDVGALNAALHSGTGRYGEALRVLAQDKRCAYLDVTAPWAEYIRSSTLHPHLFYRDKIHANEFGEQILAKILMAFWTAGAPESTEAFKSWPAGASPVEVGVRVTERFLALPHSQYGVPGKPTQITYPDVCTWYGALTFARESGNTQLTQQLAQRFEPLFGAEAQLVPPANHVDNTVFGVVPLELYLQTKEARYLTLGKRFADEQWSAPSGIYDTAENREHFKRGLTWQTRFWIDDMYMITTIQAQAFRATGDRKYLDRAAREMIAYLDALQKPNGLFYHAPEVPFYWGRGCGWMAAGMTELLRALPEDHPERPRILVGYRTMMASLLKYQSDDGMWRQLVDDPGSWPETSGTGMFAFAMITGVKRGWLDADTYGPAARKAWLALVTYLEPNGDVRAVCEGTNKKADRQFYLDRQRHTGNLHGQAPVLWCATALLGEQP
jgi:rhamnogalacturonyl hydrolase YesR